MSKELLHAALAASFVICGTAEIPGAYETFPGALGFDVFAKTGKKKCKKRVPFWYPFLVPKMGPQFWVLIGFLIRPQIRGPFLGPEMGTKTGPVFCIFLAGFCKNIEASGRQDMFLKPPSFWVINDK